MISKQILTLNDCCITSVVHSNLYGIGVSGLNPHYQLCIEALLRAEPVPEFSACWGSWN